MKIDKKGDKALEQELEGLKKKNENLRISLAALKNRPDKTDMQTLYLYDKAIHLMYEKSPGFATAWELILQDAQRELDKTNTGMAAWVRKKIRPSLNSGHAPQALPSSHEDSDIEFMSEKQKRFRR